MPSKVKIYITLDTILESKNCLYLINNNLNKTNNFFIQSLNDIYKEFKSLVDIVIISKEKDNKIYEFIKTLDFKFKYEFKFATDEEILKLHSKFCKDYVLIDMDDELLTKWTKLNGKSIRYINVNNPEKSTFELLKIKNNHTSSNDYYQKLVDYIHLCH